MSLLVALTAVVLAGDLKGVVDRVQEALQRETMVSFYFVTRTEGRFVSPEQIKSAASVNVNRSCGRNCGAFMADVIMHLEESHPTECFVGRENLLIEIGNMSLIYRESGRIIEIDDRCFLNRKSIVDVVKNDEFLFN